MLRQSHTPELVPPSIAATPEDEKLSILERSREQYNAMSPEQQRDFRLALSCTLGGMALNAVNTLVLEPRLKDSDNIALRWAPTVLRAASYGLDIADGHFAKRTRTYDEHGNVLNPGAVTDLGAVLDPLADKFNNLINELAANHRNDQLPIHVSIRVLRDLAVSFKREEALRETEGNLSVAANQWGKFNTVLRDIANTYAASPQGAAHPIVAELLQITEDVSSVVSGYQTITAINKGVAEYQGQTS